VWLQDQYAEAVGRHPLAKIDVIAHSNGTYLLGESLAHVPAMRFDRVALLGSVLPTNYPWSERRALGQVGVVRNDRAADDRIVALVTNSLHGLGMTDVGTSGWQGFDDAGSFLFEPPPVLGGHGATVSENHLRDVVEFIATGASQRTARATSLPSVLRLGSGIAPWILFLMALSLAVAATRWLWRASASSRVLRVALMTSAMIVAVIALDVF
jgi:alpha-beta hydrolase superfamily lysophospholipase